MDEDLTLYDIQAQLQSMHSDIQTRLQSIHSDVKANRTFILENRFLLNALLKKVEHIDANVELVQNALRVLRGSVGAVESGLESHVREHKDDNGLDPLPMDVPAVAEGNG